MVALVVSGSYLVRHKYGYYFRITVPEDLRPVVGLKEIRYSLKKRSADPRLEGLDELRGRE